MHGLHAFLAALVLLLVCPIARADSATTQRAAQIEREARDAYAKGEYARAAGLFNRANQLAPFPELRYNAALSWDQAGEKARAADAYEGALRLGGLDQSRVDETSTRLAALKRELGYIRVARPVGATVSVAHVEHAPIPIDIHLTPGAHNLVFELPDGSTQRKSIEARAGEATSVGIDLPKPNQLAPSPDEPTAPRRDTPTSKPESSPSSSTRTWGFVALGGAVVLGGVTAYLGTRTLKEQKRYEDSGFTDRDARDSGLSLRTWTNVALASSLVAAGAGVTLLVIGSGGSSAPSSGSLRIGVAETRAFAAVSY